MKRISTILFLAVLVELWEQPRILRTFDPVQRTQAVDFSHKGLYIVTAINNKIAVFIVPSYELLNQIPIGERVLKIICHPKNQQLAIVTTESGRILKYNIASRQLLSESAYIVKDGIIRDIEWLDEEGNSLIVVGSSVLEIVQQVLDPTRQCLQCVQIFRPRAYIYSSELEVSDSFIDLISFLNASEVSEIQVSLNYSWFAIATSLSNEFVPILDGQTQITQDNNLNRSRNIAVYNSSNNKLIKEFSSENKQGAPIIMQLFESSSVEGSQILVTHNQSFFIDVFALNQTQNTSLKQIKFEPNAKIFDIETLMPNSLFISISLEDRDEALLYSLQSDNQSAIQAELISKTVISKISVSKNQRFMCMQENGIGVAVWFDTKDQFEIETLYIILISTIVGAIFITLTIALVVYSFTKTPQSTDPVPSNENIQDLNQPNSSKNFL